ncbi:MAG: 16S rRNA (guanine(966)-N(2))-methyltransferase RsmD [Bacteroidota bacterium]|nr:16S rRNA (guanine(966)-N(2))-methyltransferase RsmD [Bacteroidota bacterium]MDP4230965.1 16S rRNA (guanine(966)-N(2))-methyltransferase RsmD [Bacteroidota bacterium]MDP4235170.1 16S rRNA (guanine(966)-N(2))-methyltransferase RsmD [Bacteroidota bacterium]
MRIISGKYKSRKLLVPKGEITRPTSDRARESLFNVLQNLIDFEGLTVLDLFAGSGAFGFEALSRGASRVTLVEQNRKVVETIRENAQSLEVESEVQIVQKDVYKWLENPHGEYDLIFADPPYDDSRTLNALPEAIFAAGLLTADSFVIIEHRSGSSIQIPQGTEQIRELHAGEAVFSFLRPFSP